jgi:hypothetical protein
MRTRSRNSSSAFKPSRQGNVDQPIFLLHLSRFRSVNNGAFVLVCVIQLPSCDERARRA